jgi:class 3 adenylate cyclase
MEFRILGPFEVTHQGRPVVLGRRERRLLAVLALSANRPVPVERLADELGEGRNSSERAVRSLRVDVSRLRRAVREAGMADILVTSPGCYSLQIDASALDATRFETLVAEGRQRAGAGDYRGAAARLREALALWRGRAFDGVDHTPLLGVEAERLEEARLAALEDRIDADLSTGRHSELTAELDALTRAHPLRERLWAQRMLALYRSGRQAEALRAYQDVRRCLAEELGLEPGAELRRREAAILRQDPELDWNPPDEARADTEPTTTPAPVAATVPLTEERRWATVVFADISGFTRFSEARDPEDVRELLAGCMTAMAEVVNRFGGIALRVVGDELIALFGAPVAHGDDAERAVRAALELHSCAGDQGGALGRLPLRVGLNTGEMMFGPVGPDREFTVVGDAVNVAARLGASAPPGGTVVGAETYRATRDAIAYRPLEAESVPGKGEPVSAYLAVEALPAARPAPARGPFVGRTTELGVAVTLWERVREEGAPHLVTLLGPPGIGKTRLAREFTGRVEQQGGRTLLGRSLPYGERTGYGAFAQQVKTLAGIYETDAPPLAQAKLSQRIASLLPVAWAEEVTSHLSLVTGLGAEAAGADKGALLFSARRFVQALGREQPTVLVFEDLHWADPSLLDLVESLAGRLRDTPVLLLALARSELLDHRPGWSGGLGSSTLLQLGELSPTDSRSLLASIVSGLSENAAETDVLVERAGGNPLFLEELAAAVQEQRWAPVEDLPGTIKSIIAARLDALPPPERQVLFDASVVGKIFWTGALSGAAGRAECRAVLDRLEARDLVRRQPHSQIEGDDEFAFKHILIREVAYATLPKAARRIRHAAAGRFLEDAAGERVAESAALLAHHWREAGDTGRAAHYLLVAAERAAQAWAKGEAINLYDEALRLLPEADVEQRRTVRLRRALLLAQENDVPAAAAALDALIPELDGPALVEALTTRGYISGFMEDAAVMETTGGRAVELAEALADPGLLGAALSIVGAGKLFTGEVADALAVSERALAIWPPHSRPADFAVLLGTAGNEAYLLGRYAEAVDYGQRGYELGREVHRGDPTLWAGVQLGLGLAGLGRHEEAIRHLVELVSFGHQLGTLPIPTGIATNCLAGVLREVGDLAAARSRNHEAIELVAPSGYPLVTVEAKVDLIFADLDEGDFGRAQRVWPAVWEQALDMPGVHRWRNLGRLEAARVMLSLATEQWEQAEEEARAAIAGARRVGRVKYEIACRVVLGRALLELGYQRDAIDQLRQAASAADVLGHPQSQWQAEAALTLALAATGDDNGAATQAARLQESISRFATTLSEEHRKAFQAARWVRELAALTG